MMNSNQEDNQRLEIISRTEYTDVSFVCDLTDVAWWKRPNLLATRYGVILPKFRSKMSLEPKEENIQTQVLNIHQLQSNDSGIYECETLGAIRQFNLTVIGRIFQWIYQERFVAASPFRDFMRVSGRFIAGIRSTVDSSGSNIEIVDKYNEQEFCL